MSSGKNSFIFWIEARPSLNFYSLGLLAETKYKMAATALSRGIRKKNEVHIKFDFKFEFEPPQQPDK
jgi:hypothetical protein